MRQDATSNCGMEIEQKKASTAKYLTSWKILALHTLVRSFRSLRSAPPSPSKERNVLSLLSAEFRDLSQAVTSPYLYSPPTEGMRSEAAQKPDRMQQQPSWECTRKFDLPGRETSSEYFDMLANVV